LRFKLIKIGDKFKLKKLVKFYLKIRTFDKVLVYYKKKEKEFKIKFEKKNLFFILLFS